MGCPAESDSLLYFFSIKDSTSAENTDFQMRQVLRPNWQNFEIFGKFEKFVCHVVLIFCKEFVRGTKLLPRVQCLQLHGLNSHGVEVH